MKTAFLFLLIFCVAFSGKSFSANENEYRAIVENYMQAITSQDDGAILSSWREINKLPDVQIYMEKEYPLAAYSFRMTGMTIKLADDLKRYQDTYPDGPLFSGLSPVQASLRTSPQTNRDETLNSPNQKQPSQQQQVDRDQKSGLISNQATAANDLNQEQRSNEQLIGDDLRRMGL